MFLAIIDKDDAPYCLPAVNEVKEASQRASQHFDTNIQCPCGKPQHSQLYRNIVCVFCFCYTHEECCNRFADKTQWDEFVTVANESYDVGLNQENNESMVSDKYPVWTICPNCSLQTADFLPAKECAINQDDTSKVLPPTHQCYRPTQFVHKKHSCESCQLPVHPTCCMYIDNPNPNPIMSRRVLVPQCMVCFVRAMNYDKATSLPFKNWNPQSYPRHGSTFIESPFKLSFGDFENNRPAFEQFLQVS